MKTLRRVLVALSLTDTDAGLLRYAALVSQLGESLAFDFVHVLQSTDTSEHQQAQARIDSQVAAYFGASRDGLSLLFHTCHGSRLDNLLRFAGEHGSDVILLGHGKAHRGRRSLVRHLATAAPCSVWLVPDGSPSSLTTILVPIDFSDHAADSLTVATSIALRQGLERCLALHVFFDRSTVRYEEHVDEVRRNEELAFASFLERVDCQGVRVEAVFEESTHVPQAILRVAHRYDADLIVMNTRGRSRAAAVLLGSVTSDTIAQTDVPMLVVKHFGALMGLFQALINKHLLSTPEPKTN